MPRLFALGVCLTLGVPVQAQPNLASLHKLGLQPVRFKHPVEIYLRLDLPVPGAEHRLVMEKALVPFLDTLTLYGLLHHPGIYFSKLHSSSVPRDALQRFPYRQVGPTARGTGLYPFNNQRVNSEAIQRPFNDRFYWQWEPARPYRTWEVRRDPTDMGVSDRFNTLPGVDSVRMIYVLEKRKMERRIRVLTERLR